MTQQGVAFYSGIIVKGPQRPGPVLSPTITGVLVSGRDPRAMDARGPAAGQRVPIAGGGMQGQGQHNMAANVPPPARPVKELLVSIVMLVKLLCYPRMICLASLNDLCSEPFATVSVL